MMRKLVSYCVIFILGVMMLTTTSCTDTSTDQQAPKKEIKFQFGVASYSLRNFSADTVIAFAKQLGLDYVAFKSMHLKLDASDEEIAGVLQKCEAGGVNLYAGGVIYMKTEAEVDQAFEYARKAGMKMIIGVPAHELLSYVEGKVKEYDIKLAIHNHGPGDKLYPSAESAYLLIKDMDPRMGLCIDIGHTARIQRSPSQDVKDFFDRVLDIHVKDVTKADAEGTTCEVGRGVIDIKTFFADLIALNYQGIVSFEYEKDGDNPFVGMAESVGYVKGVLAAVQ